MVRGIAATVVVLLGAVCADHAALAHGGGLNAAGCHNNRKTGDYHCHRGGGDGDSGAASPPGAQPPAPPHAQAPPSKRAAAVVPKPAPDRTPDPPAEKSEPRSLAAPRKPEKSSPPSGDGGSGGGGLLFFVFAGLGTAGFLAWRSTQKRQQSPSGGHWHAPAGPDSAVLLACDLAAVLRSVATADRRLSIEERMAFHSLFAQFFWNRPDIAGQALWHLDNAATAAHEVAAALSRMRMLEPGLRSQLLALAHQIAQADQKITPKEQERLAAIGAALTP